MPAAGAQPQPGQEDGSTAILWAIAAIFVILGLMWYVFKEQIISGYLALKLWELRGLSFVTRNENIATLQNVIQSANHATLRFDDVVSMGQMVGTYLRIPLTAIMGALMFIVYFGNSTRLFKTTYSMKVLAQSEKVNWPQIGPVLGLDLVHTDIDKGPWAMAMTPIQFCRKYNLIEEFRRPRQEGVSRKEGDKVEVMLRRGEANKVFALQLGPRWEGISRLPPYSKALFAIFAARINADTKTAYNLIMQLNRSIINKVDYRGVDALIKKHEGSKIVKQILSSHAYVLTMMAAMITAARLDGVQATADFLWLKPLDRRLWYVLNTMGRQTPFVEAAGPFAHWLSEKEAGRKLIVPMVEGATTALEIALKAMVYHPEEEK